MALEDYFFAKSTCCRCFLAFSVSCHIQHSRFYGGSHVERLVMRLCLVVRTSFRFQTDCFPTIVVYQAFMDQYATPAHKAPTVGSSPPTHVPNKHILAGTSEPGWLSGHCGWSLRCSRLTGWVVEVGNVRGCHINNEEVAYMVKLC